jgi:ribosome-associated protein
VRITEVEIADEMVRLGQFLKLAGLADAGSDAKQLVEAGEVAVNGRVEVRRGRQLRNGDVVRLGEQSVRVKAEGGQG